MCLAGSIVNNRLGRLSDRLAQVEATNSSTKASAADIDGHFFAAHCGVAAAVVDEFASHPHVGTANVPKKNEASSTGMLRYSSDYRHKHANLLMQLQTQREEEAFF